MLGTLLTLSEPLDHAHMLVVNVYLAQRKTRQARSHSPSGGALNGGELRLAEGQNGSQ